MIEAFLLASIVTVTPTVPSTPPVVAPTPKPTYTPSPSVPPESWSDKMWRRYKDNQK